MRSTVLALALLLSPLASALPLHQGYGAIANVGYSHYESWYLLGGDHFLRAGGPSLGLGLFLSQSGLMSALEVELTPNLLPMDSYVLHLDPDVEFHRPGLLLHPKLRFTYWIDNISFGLSTGYAFISGNAPRENVDGYITASAEVSYAFVFPVRDKFSVALSPYIQGGGHLNRISTLHSLSMWGGGFQASLGLRFYATMMTELVKKPGNLEGW